MFVYIIVYVHSVYLTGYNEGKHLIIPTEVEQTKCSTQRTTEIWWHYFEHVERGRLIILQHNVLCCGKYANCGRSVLLLQEVNWSSHRFHCFAVNLELIIKKVANKMRLLLLIKCYNLYKVSACSTTFFQLSLFCTIFSQLLIFMFFISFKTSPSQHVLGLPVVLLNMGFHLLIVYTIQDATIQVNLLFLVSSTYTPHNPHSSVSTHPRHQPAATWVNTTRYCK
jgi:hypothetical protein